MDEKQGLLKEMKFIFKHNAASYMMYFALVVIMLFFRSGQRELSSQHRTFPIYLIRLHTLLYLL